MSSQSKDSGRSATITWLGQAGFIIETAQGTTILVDAFLNDHELRLYPPPATESLGSVRAALVTHEHGDHLDLATLLSIQTRSPKMTALVPSGLASAVSQSGLRRVVGLERGEEWAVDDVTVTAVPAVHAVAIEDGYTETPHAEARWLGYVIALRDGPKFWHGGDTLASPAVIEAVRKHDVDVAVLPVNGRDTARETAGIVGNMSSEEAVRSVVDLGVPVLIPMHHDLIRGNIAPAGETADVVRANQAAVNVLSLARMTPFHLTAQRPTRHRIESSRMGTN